MLIHMTQSDNRMENIYIYILLPIITLGTSSQNSLQLKSFRVSCVLTQEFSFMEIHDGG